MSTEPAGAWFFFRPDTLPESWRNRAVEVLMVPLLPDEAAAMMPGSGEAFGTSEADGALFRLVMQGKSINTMARELGRSTRSIERQLAALRKRFGVKSTTELAALLAGRGF